jgi:peptidoglycan/xylan/chitin deacetylase (PgdA/CDA1 family)
VQQTTINLTFHGIGEPGRELEPGERDVWVSRARFLDVLDAVAGRHDVRITFDDGNASDVEQALPALRSRGLTGTFFVVAGRIGAPGYLDAGGIRVLAAGGMTVGSHGMWHRPWRGLDASGAHEELVDARRMLEDVVGRPVTEAACPFGAYDRRTLRALRRAGYRHVYTSDRGTAHGRQWLQARTTLRAHDGDEQLGRILAGEPRSALRRAKLTVKRWR